MRTLWTGILMTGLLICLAAGASPAKLVNRIVAVVNGEIITLHELQQQLSANAPGMEQGGGDEGQRSQAMQRRVLEAMINDTLVKQQADKFEIDVSDVEVQNQIDQIQSENGLSQSELRQAIQDQGMDMEEYRQALRDEIKKNRVLSSMVRQKVVVAEDEMRSYYDKHQDQFRRPKTVGLRIIVHPSRERVKQVRRAVASGDMSFAQAAASVSQGPGADQGGRLGSFEWKDLKPDWRRMLDGLQAGQMTPVFSLQGNAALLAVEDVADKQVQPFEAVKDKIRQQIYGQKLEDRYQEYIQGLREKAVIDLRLEQTG